MLNVFKLARRFATEKSGAVTVDWVALTAAVVVIGIGLAYAVFGTGDDGVAGLVTNLTTELGQASTNIEGAVATELPTAGGDDG
ncbi:MAG: pilus assembly protein [Pseudomonadota bacterium]